MRVLAIASSLMLIQVCFAGAQEIPGLSYCLLFDSKLEKSAFQETDRSNCDPMIFLLAYDPKIDSSQYDAVRQEISTFAGMLTANRLKYREEFMFLKYVFHKVHKQYLKHYDNTEKFTGIFNNGSYNCVSGTALYATILSQLGYSPVIFETRYHIFLKVALNDSLNCLFEATDPIDGFEYKARGIETRVKGYLDNEAEIIRKQEAISAPFTKSILQQVSLVELGGLHYFNLAVDLMNKGNYYDAFRALKKASFLYSDSQRIHDFLEFTRLKYEAELAEAFID